MKEIQKQAPWESVAGFAKQIKELWVQSRSDTLSDTFRLARTVYEGRDRLSRNWAALWKESGHLMPFSKRKGDMLVGIWRGLGWVDDNEQTFAYFPKCRTTLYYLGQLERFQLEALIEKGTVHSELTLREARELVAEYNNGQLVSKDPKGSDVRKRARRFFEYLNNTFEKWSPEDRAWITGEILRMKEPVRALFAVAKIPDTAAPGKWRSSRGADNGTYPPANPAAGKAPHKGSRG